MGAGLLTQSPLADSMVLPRMHAPPFSRAGLLDRAAIVAFARSRSRSSTSVPRARWRAPARYRAATCRRRCLRANSPPIRRWCSPLSRRAASTSAPPGSSTANSWSCARKACGLLVISEDLEELFALPTASPSCRRPHRRRCVDRRGDGRADRPDDDRSGGGVIRVRLERRERRRAVAAARAAGARHRFHAPPLQRSGRARRAPVLEAYAQLFLTPFSSRFDLVETAGEGGAASAYRACGRRRLPRQVLEHRRGGPVAGRRHGRGFIGERTMPAGLRA